VVIRQLPLLKLNRHRTLVGAALLIPRSARQHFYDKGDWRPMPFAHLTLRLLVSGRCGIELLADPRHENHSHTWLESFFRTFWKLYPAKP
jgi:hypothetical protein